MKSRKEFVAQNVVFQWPLLKDFNKSEGVGD